MGTVPAPNIAAFGGQIAQNPLEEYGRAQQLESQAQTIQQQKIQTQQQQLDLQDAQNAHRLGPQFLQKDADGKITGFDNEGYYNALIGTGMNPVKIMGMRQQNLTYQQGLTKLSQDQLDLQNKKNDDAYQITEPIRQLAQDPNADVGHLNSAWQSVAPRLAQLGIDPKTLPAAFQSPQDASSKLRDFETELGQHKQLLADAKTQGETQEAVGKGAQASAEAAFTTLKTKGLMASPGDVHQMVSAVVQGSSDPTLGPRTEALMNSARSLGNVDAMQKALADASNEIGGVQKDIAEKTNPAIQAADLHLATAKKAAEQAITDGDPKAAAQLLIDGTVAPSQIISSRKPAFAQQAFTAAAQMQPGWSATKADADFKVAGSAQNVAFFGSAKSLTDKGGTLDQLAAAAKDIPANQIPVFNSVADAIKASTGSGPIARYAALTLGVADDYSKVMGGGQGSDTSRTQAMNLIAAKQSPEQRAASIEGIRGAVSSQTNSRIGANPVLRKMYGGSAPKTTQADPLGIR